MEYSQEGANPATIIKINNELASDLGLSVAQVAFGAASLRRRRPDQPLAGAGRPELRSQRAAAAQRPPEGGRPGRPVAGLLAHGCERQPDHGAAAPGGRVRALVQPAGAETPGAGTARGDLRRHRRPALGRRECRHQEGDGIDRTARRRALRRRRRRPADGRDDGQLRLGDRHRDHLHLPGAGLPVRQLPAAGRDHDVAADVAHRRAAGACWRRAARSTCSR